MPLFFCDTKCFRTSSRMASTLVLLGLAVSLKAVPCDGQRPTYLQQQSSTLVSELNPDLSLQRRDKQYAFIVLGQTENRTEQDGKLIYLLPPTVTLVHSEGPDIPLVNKSSPFWPPAGRYVNYIAARPRAVKKYIRHSEVILFGQFPQLLESYTQHVGDTPDFLLLYTWYTPCPRCVGVILQNYSNYSHIYPDMQWIVGYSEDFGNANESSHNRDRLRDSGIYVFNGTCVTTPTNTTVDCPVHNTFQTYLLYCLSDAVACNCSGKNAMKVAFVNWFSDYCFPSYSSECIESFVDEYSRVINCPSASQIQSSLETCLNTSISLPLVRPLDPRDPSKTAAISTWDDLKAYTKPDKCLDSNCGGTAASARGVESVLALILLHLLHVLLRQ